ncbi:MAG: diguanylate cyclase [Desulfopila sp.]|nr:diguanylate cyclase [Desulfopila sp.]
MANILILNTTSHDSRDVQQVLDLSGFSVFTTEKMETIPEILAKRSISLFVFVQDSFAIPSSYFDLNISATIPILLYNSTQTSIEKCSTPSSNLVIEYLHAPLSREKVHRKVKLLLRLNSLATELEKAKEEIGTLQQQIHELHRSIEGHNTFLDLISRRDGLTGLFNRHHFNTVIKEFFNTAFTEEDDLALLVLNIDYFSEINKTYGQDFGDFVLNELSARITNCSRQGDMCFRLSGEDFAVLMPSSSNKTALQKAEELRLTCAGKPFDNGSYSRNVTISAGIASLEANSPKSHEELITMADQALFLAKSEGRNRCISHNTGGKEQYNIDEQNFKMLQESVSKILSKTKTSTIRSIQLLAQGVLQKTEQKLIKQTQEYTTLLSRHLQFPLHLCQTFSNAAILLNTIRYLLHEDMLKKKGSLSGNEKETLADFPYKLVQITELFDYFSQERILLYHHGEKFDGTGYPEGLQGEQIPVGARIFNLINAFTAMQTDRPYRKKLPPEEILSELSKNAGTQFDPVLVLKLIDVIEERGILEIDRKHLENARKNIRKNTPSLLQ